MKTHLKVDGVDCRDQGQTEYEFDHQAACGYVRKKVTTNGHDVDCFYCLNSVHMVNYHAVNKTLTDYQGYY